MKKPVLLAIVILILALTACTTVDYSANMSGASDYVTVAVKDFISLGIVTVYSTEIHHSSPFGFVRSVEGSKVTFTDLMQEAAKLEADDVINVRIDRNSNYKKNIFNFITGWTKVYTYTGTALAIKYTDKVDITEGDSHLGTLPKAPEATGVIRINRFGEVKLR